MKTAEIESTRRNGIERFTMTSLSRGTAISLLTCAALAATHGTLGAQTTPAPIRVGLIPIDPGAEIFYALDQGYFAKAGIDVDVQVMNSGAAIGAALVAGALDIGQVDLVSMASAHVHGIPLVYVAPGAIYTVDAPSHQILVRKDSTIHNARDLHGHIVAVNGLSNIDTVSLAMWIKKNGADPKQVKTIEIPFPAMATSLENGNVDAIVVPEPFASLTHGRYRALDLGNSGMADRFMVSGWASTAAWAETHAAAARDFRSSILAAAKWANQNHALSAKSLAKHTKIAPDVAASMLRTRYAEQLDTSIVQPFIDAAADAGVIPKGFAAQEIVVKSS